MLKAAKLLFLTSLLCAGPLAAQCHTSGTQNAEFIRMVAPPKVAGGATFEVVVVMKNTGARCWDSAGSPQHGLSLDFHANGNGGNWGTPRFFPVPAGEGVVTTGEFATFHLQLVAPATVGTYTLQLQMEQNSTHFGQKAPLGAQSIEVACPTLANTTPGMNGSTLVSVSAPDKVAASGFFEARVEFQNTGTSCWQDLPGTCVFAVGTNSTGTPVWPSPYRYLLPTGHDPVLPGESAVFTLPLQAPVTVANNYPLTLQMVRSQAGCNGGPAWFGPSTTADVDVVASPGTDGATYLSQDLPPVAVRGETYAVKVKMRNSGSSTWTTAGGYVLSVPGDDLTWTSGLTNRPPLPHDVKPNQEVTFDFTIKAPASAAFTALNWRMLKTGVARFGDTSPATTPEERDMSNKIQVSGDSFVDGVTEFVVKGFNDIPFYDHFALSDFDGYGLQELAWLAYDEERVESDLRNQARLGANVVRLWAPGGVLDLANGTSVTTVCGHFNHYLDEAYKNGIRVALTLNKPSAFVGEVWGDFCAGDPGFCELNRPGFMHSLMFHEPLRDWNSQRNLDMLDACGVIADPRPRLFSIEPWNEPNAGDPRVWDEAPGRFTGHEALIQAWHDWVLARYEDDPETFADAQLAWGYTLAGDAITCGDDENLLCPPTDVELCCDPDDDGDPTLLTSYSCRDGASAGTWKEMANDYRLFIHEAMRETLEAWIDDYRNFEDGEGVPSNDRYLTRLSLPSIFASNRAQYDQACKGGIHVPDPWVVEGLTDYRSTHLYTWNDAVAAKGFDDAADDLPTPWGLEGAGQRYHQLRLMLDYIRGDQPVVLEETGYTQLCWDPLARVAPGRLADVPTTDCSQRETVQREVYERTIEAVSQVRGNGALFFYYAAEGAGVVHADGTPRPVEADIPGLFATLDAGRATDAPSPMPSLTLYPCSSNNLGRALMFDFDDYLTAADLPGDAWSPVSIPQPTGACLP